MVEAWLRHVKDVLACASPSVGLALGLSWADDHLALHRRRRGQPGVEEAVDTFETCTSTASQVINLHTKNSDYRYADKMDFKNLKKHTELN